MTPETERDLRSALELRASLRVILEAWRFGEAPDVGMHRVDQALRDDAARASATGRVGGPSHR